MSQVISHPCTITNDYYSVVVETADYNDWLSGKSAQDAFPYLSAPDREFIISGTSPNGWIELWGDDQ